MMDLHMEVHDTYLPFVMEAVDLSHLIGRQGSIICNITKMEQGGLI